MQGWGAKGVRSGRGGATSDPSTLGPPVSLSSSGQLVVSYNLTYHNSSASYPLVKLTYLHYAIYPYKGVQKDNLVLTIHVRVAKR